MLVALFCLLTVSVVLNWYSVRATVREIAAPQHARMLAQACKPLDLILDTAIIAPHSMSIHDALLCVERSRKALTYAGAEPYRAPDPAKILRAASKSGELPPGETEESRAARQSLSADPRFLGLVIGHDAFVRGLDPEEDEPWTPEHGLSFAILMMLDVLIRAVYRARYQGPAAVDRLAHDVIECGVAFERGV